MYNPSVQEFLVKYENGAANLGERFGELRYSENKDVIYFNEKFFQRKSSGESTDL